MRRIKNAMYCGSSSVDRALAFQAKGRGFESRLPLKTEIGVLSSCVLFIPVSLCVKSRSSSGVERILGKDEVTSSILVFGSMNLDNN